MHHHSPQQQQQQQNRRPHTSLLGATDSSNLSNRRTGTGTSSLLSRETSSGYPVGGAAPPAPIAPTPLASSSSTDLAHYGADDEGKGEPVAGPGGGVRHSRIDSIGSSSTTGDTEEDAGNRANSTSSPAPMSLSHKRRSRGPAAPNSLNLGSLPVPAVAAGSSNTAAGALGTQSAATSTPVAVPTPTPRQGSGRAPAGDATYAKRGSRSQLRDDYLAFQYGSGADSDVQARSSDASSESSVRGSGPAVPTAAGTAFTRTANHTDSEGQRSGSDTDQGTASPYDGDVEFAARTPVSMQIANHTTQANAAAVHAAQQPIPGGDFSKQASYKAPDASQLSHALAAASVSSHGASADIESSVESSSPPVMRGSGGVGGGHRSTLSAHTSPLLTQMMTSKSNAVRDVPSRVYASGSTLTGGRRAVVGQHVEANTSAPRSAAPTTPAYGPSPRHTEPDSDAISNLVQGLNSPAKLASLLKGGTSSSTSPLKVYVQTSFDVPSLEACSSRLRTAKLFQGRRESTPDVVVIAGVVTSASGEAANTSSSHTLPLQQRAALARNCRWVDEVVEGVPYLAALEQSTGALTMDSAEQLQIQRLLKDVGADCAARFCLRNTEGGENVAPVSVAGGAAATPAEEASRTVNLPIF